MEEAVDEAGEAGDGGMEEAGLLCVSLCNGSAAGAEGGGCAVYEGSCCC